MGYELVLIGSDSIMLAHEKYVKYLYLAYSVRQPTPQLRPRHDGFFFFFFYEHCVYSMLAM